MYAAKRQRNSSAVFHPRMYDAARHRLEIQNGLHQALRLKQFALYLQPLISVDGGIAGAEALIRWKDPSWGLRLPAEFIEIAEQSGLIVQIGEWVMGEACRLSQAFGKRGFALPIAVNVSSKEFEYGHVLNSIDRALARSDTDPRALTAEITETGIMRDVTRSIRVMQSLRALGVGIALDDFGTGYSSLGHLKSFPIDSLKIDRKLLQDVATDRQDREIVTAVVHLAAATNLTVVAEGVESAAQVSILRELGCHVFQGYYYCRPLPAEEFLDFAAVYGK